MSTWRYTPKTPADGPSISSRHALPETPPLAGTHTWAPVHISTSVLDPRHSLEIPDRSRRRPPVQSSAVEPQSSTPPGSVLGDCNLSPRGSPAQPSATVTSVLDAPEPASTPESQSRAALGQSSGAQTRVLGDRTSVLESSGRSPRGTETQSSGTKSPVLGGQSPSPRRESHAHGPGISRGRARAVGTRYIALSTCW